MEGNPYSKHPLKVVLLDPRRGVALRTYVLLGAAPKAVAEAARRVGKWRAEPAPVAIRDAEVLRGHFGADWKVRLAAEEGPGRGEYDMYDGGAAGEFGDLDDFDHIEDLPAEGENAPPREAAPITERLGRPAADSGPLIYSDVAAYPEDSIWDLRLKIFMATGISPYRQHLYYTTADGRLRHPYRVALEGSPVVTDIRTLFTTLAAGAAAALIAGVPVDSKYEEQKESLTVEALDTFQKLEIGPGVYVTTAYIVDLYGVIPPVGEGSTQKREELTAVLQDKYQFDLLYYGGIVRFWPQLSPDALQLALADPESLPGTYPLLAPDPVVLRARLGLERTIAERAHAYRFPRDPRTRPSIAVTSAEVQVKPEGIQTQISARNIFNGVPTSLAVPAIVARFDVTDPESGTVASVAAARRHASSFMPRLAHPLGRFAARPPRKPAVAFAVLRAEAERGAGPASALLAYVTLREDARYTAASQWREDDRVPFERVREDLARATAPLIGAINAMGAAALTFGGELAEISGAHTTAFGAITASAFWPHAVTSEGFRQIKNRWRDYERAGIVGIKGLQQAGAYVLQFRKGVVGYDPATIERVAIRRAVTAPGRPAEETVSVANRYAYLTDASVLARWNALYGGRTVRIYHRATDLRIEVVGAEGLGEFDIIRQYLFSFLEGLLHGPGRIEGLRLERQHQPRERTAEEETLRGPGSRRLRRLQERDPNLFDLKKYDENATVYSVLCQAERQPHIYNEAEIATMPAKRRATLTKYWNFTENRPAFYECPSSRYPYLSFRAGQHPLGWCLVCCKKTHPAPGSRAALINEGCVRSRKWEAAADEESASRHVLAYGKAIPVGRVAEAATTVAEGILHEALPPPYSLKLVGVPQTAPAVPDAGFMYSVAAAVADEDATLDEVVRDLAKTCLGLEAAFSALGAGAAVVFASAADLADSLVKAFAERSPDLSPLGPGGPAGATWREIVRDLVRLTYGVEIVVFADRGADGDVIIEAPPETIEAFFPSGVAVRLPLRVALIAVVGGASAAGGAGTYPVFAMDPKVFLRTTAPGRSSQARRIFEAEAVGARSGLRDKVTPLTDHVVAMLKEVLALAGPAPGAVLDLRFLVETAAAGKEYQVLEKLVNLRGRCYGATLKRASDAPFFFPVRESPCASDGIPIRFGPRAGPPTDESGPRAFLAALNAHAKKVGERVKEAAFIPVATLVDPSDSAIGFAIGDPAGSFLLCYHKPVAGDPVGKTPGDALPALSVPYDPLEVDAAIVDAKGGAPLAIAPAPPASTSAYLNRLYRLFVAEFAAAMKEEKNEPVRKRMTAAITGTRFDSPDSVSKLRDSLATILEPYPDDLRAVRVIIARELSQPSHDIATSIDRAVAASVFAFDLSTLRELRAKTHAEIVAAARSIMAPRIEVRSADAEHDGVGAPGNIFAACTVDSSVERPQCYGGKLLVPADHLESLTDILAADIADPRKTVALTMAAGVFDERSLVERPGETLRLIEAPWL